jgi:transcriptional regulator with PAS, ATPase and Fis domain
MYSSNYPSPGKKFDPAAPASDSDDGFVKLLQHPGIAEKVLDSFPCGLLILNEEGRVRASNKFLELKLGINRNAIMGNLVGEALGCLKALENPGKCRSTEHCKTCEIRSLGLAAIKKNRVQKARTSIQLVNNGQVRDVDLMVSAIPFDLRDQRFSILVIEDTFGPPLIDLQPRAKGTVPIVGQHAKMKELYRSIAQIAQSRAPVLIQGETGTGKELVALSIHENSPRAGKYFVPINCGALPEGLLESELFGHVKGAFTGAIRDQKGRFELADGGSLFLDEVGELNPVMQVKLLRVLQDGKFQPVGSEKTLRADVRIISATNKDLQKDVAGGRFRKDLYYRLSSIPVVLPPLRVRRSDIPLLARHFLKLYEKEFFRKGTTLSSKAVSALMGYDWPGNVRELQNAIQYALAKCLEPVIELSHLPHTIRFSTNQPFHVRHRRALPAEDVTAALEKSHGNKAQAAKLLGVSRITLYRFLAKHEKGHAEE